ncbi:MULTISPECIES: LysR substrate-binding domain-containing protein, partial [Streptomyces]|uniref:LysR substrate-binding domain-containing protein n=1 Tax=Streptomyces TaxID=1883 RepID=UPI0004AADC22
MHHDLQIGPLRTLVTIVELGGFRRAAEALHITQPAVSQQMRRLASVLPEPIFLNTGRELRLSSTGDELLGYARRIVSLNDEAVERFTTPRGGRKLLIGVSDQLADSLPGILRAVSLRDPELRTTVHSGPSESLESRVSAGELDLALLLDPTKTTAYEVHDLGRVQVSWFGRPVLDGDSVVPLSLFTEPSSLRRHVLDVLETSGVNWSIGYEGSDLAGVRAATQAGLGVACLIANAEELWGLPAAGLAADLPCPEPLPVGLAVPPGLAPELARVATRAAQTALLDYPLD